jgi:Cu/Ag efflux protein CusF
MKSQRLPVLILAVAVATASPTAAQNRTAPVQPPLIDGQVTKVDPATGKITIKHGPAPSLGMDEGMTMVYRAADPAMLGAVKSGDRIRFNAGQVNGQYTVTRIEKAN